jgi:hypothetical protein
MSRNRVSFLRGEGDRAEAALRTLDEKMAGKSGISVFHLLTMASIVGSIWLFLKGRKVEGIFVGLWPPTFEALRSAAKKR